jgi:hypothetical protein
MNCRKTAAAPQRGFAAPGSVPVRAGGTRFDAPVRSALRLSVPHKPSTRELTGRSKRRNGDVGPSCAGNRPVWKRVPQKPGSGDGKIGAGSGQIGRLCETGGFSTLNNGQRQFVAKPLAPQLSSVEPVSGESGRKCSRSVAIDGAKV